MAMSGKKFNSASALLSCLQDDGCLSRLGDVRMCDTPICTPSKSLIGLNFKNLCVRVGVGKLRSCPLRNGVHIEENDLSNEEALHQDLSALLPAWLGLLLLILFSVG